MRELVHAENCYAGKGDAAICTCGAWKQAVAEELGETPTAMERVAKGVQLMHDAINPRHYRSHPSGIECIQVTEHMNFNRGNAVKYIWRADEKGDPVENLKKARWYIERGIARLSAPPAVADPYTAAAADRFKATTL